MKILPLKKNRGFTLVEMTIYVGLMATLTLAITQSLIVVLKSNRGSFAEVNLRNSGYGAMEGMLREIHSSDGITSPSATGSILQMTQGTTTVKFATSSSVSPLYFYEGPATTGPLTSKNISVKSLTFSKISTGKSLAVRIQMKLETTVNNVTKSEWFYGTGILRGSY